MPNWNLFHIANRETIPTFWNREAERQERLNQYKLVWEAYLAELPDPIHVDRSGPNDNIKINPSRAIIDTGVYFLFGRPVNFHVHPEESDAEGQKSFGQKPQSKFGDKLKEGPGYDPDGDDQEFSPGKNGEGKAENPEHEEYNRSQHKNTQQNANGPQDEERNRDDRNPDQNRDQDRQRQDEQDPRDKQADVDRQQQNRDPNAKGPQGPQDNLEAPNAGESGYQDNAHPKKGSQTHSELSAEEGGKRQDNFEERQQFNRDRDERERQGGGGFHKGGKFPGEPGKSKGAFDKGGYQPPLMPPKPVDPPWLKKLNKAWKANNKHQFLMNLGKSGAIHGDVFVKFVPNAAGTMNQYPRLVLLDPANVDVATDPNDVDHILQFTIDYITEEVENDYTKPVRRVQRITQSEDGQSWEIRDYEQRMVFENHDWVLGNNPEVQLGPTQIWPYPWPPIEHAQNLPLPHMFWGMPDLDESSIEVLQSLQRSMSTMNKIVRIHSAPRLFAKNVMPDMLSEIDISPENIIALPQMDADLQVLKILDNLTSALEFTKQIKSDLLEMVRMPAIALGHVEDAASAASGINMSVLYSPLIQKTEEKQITYGNLLIRICQKMLVLMGEKFTEDMEDICVEWPECMPGSKYLERQTLQQDLQMGVSQYTITKKLGYNPDEEQSRNSAMQNQQIQQQAEADMAVNSARFGDDFAKRRMMDQGKGQGFGGGGNNNPSGYGNKGGSMGAANKNTPKRQQF